MESVKVKLTPSSITEVGQPDQYGNHAYGISFAEGSSGFFKCKEQDLFVVGQLSEFYITETEGKSGKVYNKIQRVSAIEFEQPGKPLTAGTSGSGSGTSESGSGKSREVNDMINRSVAIKAICELRQGSSIQPMNIIEEAEILFDYIQFGVSNGDPKDGHQKALEIPVSEVDDLPF